MKTLKYVHRGLVAAAFGLVLILSCGCGKNEEPQAEGTAEKSKIDQMTDQAAEKAVEKIRTPIDKARATKDLGDERTDAMDKAIQK